MIEELSENMENYLEAIWELERVNKVARVKEIAERLGIRSGSASGALKNLAEKGLINYEPYSFITLTDEGRAIAEDIAHRHEVLKDFLENILQIDPEIAEKNACKMEHAIDELTKLLESIEKTIQNMRNFGIFIRTKIRDFLTDKRGIMKDELSLRLVRSSDLDFLRRVYASTRIDELRQVDWSAEQKDFFIGMQFEAQHKYYRENYKKAEFLIVIKGDTQVGRLYVDRRPDDIRIMDLALLPEFRGEKIGTKILENLLEEGKKKRIKVSFHVERHNRAIRLYKRLGFEKVGTDGVYFLMERDPAK